MRYGIFLQPLHHPSTDPKEALRQDLELLGYLDSLGIDEAWIGEHHSTGWENVGSPELIIASAAERTETIRFGTGVLQLGLHHPLVALDRMILLDHMTEGRTTFGMGVGGGIPSDLTVFGLDYDVAGRRMGESLQAMLALLEAKAPVNMKTDWFELHEAKLQMRPFSQPHMPFAVASSHPENVEMMGQLGGLVLMGGMPAKVGSVYEHLKRGAQITGTTASREQIRLSYVLHLAPTTEEAVESFKEGAIREFYEFEVGVNGRPEPTGTPDEWYESYVASHIIGSPEDAVRKIQSITEDSGGVGGLLFMNRDWAGVEANRESWRLLKSEVAPALP